MNIRKLHLAAWVLLFAWLLSGCRLPGAPEATPTPLPPSETPAPSSTPAPSATPEPTDVLLPPAECEITAPAGINIYTRPSASAELFYVTGGAEVMPPAGARTADGWLGFDPGVAQAGNVGVFRYRWLLESEVTTSGGCAELPVVVGPAAGVCYTMIVAPTDLRAGPDATAALVLTLNVEDYAEVLGTDLSGGWVKVDLARGSPAQALQGWIEIGSLNLNGPCENLPAITP